MRAGDYILLRAGQCVSGGAWGGAIQEDEAVADTSAHCQHSQPCGSEYWVLNVVVLLSTIYIHPRQASPSHAVSPLHGLYYMENKGGGRRDGSGLEASEFRSLNYPDSRRSDTRLASVADHIRVHTHMFTHTYTRKS